MIVDLNPAKFSVEDVDTVNIYILKNQGDKSKSSDFS